MKLNISFPATGCQKLIEMDDEWKLHTSYEKHVATEVAADTLGEERKGYTWAEPVVGMTKRVSPWSRVSWPMAESTCYWVRDIPITDQRGLKKESTNLYEVALWKSIWVFSIWSSWKKGQGYSWTHWYYCASLPGAKEASRTCKLFSLSKHDVCQCVLRKPLNKEGKIVYW